MKKTAKIFLRHILFYSGTPISLLIIICYKIHFFSFKTCSILLSKIPGLFGILIRRSFYQNTLQKCGNDLKVFYGAFIVYPTVEIGNNCTIEEYSIISNCIIGNDVIIAARVSIMSGAHHHDVNDIDNTFYNSRSSYKKIRLGDNLWIGTHSVIMANIGSNTAIAAGAVVTKPIDEYSVVGGVPAKLLKKRN